MLRGLIEQDLDLLLLLLERVLGLDDLRDVTAARRAPDHVVAVVHRRQHDGDLGARAVLAPAHRGEVLDGLALRDAREVVRERAFAAGTHQDPRGLADDLFGTIAEQALGAAVPRRARAVEALAEPRVVGPLHDAGELL